MLPTLQQGYQSATPGRLQQLLEVLSPPTTKIQDDDRPRDGDVVTKPLMPSHSGYGSSVRDKKGANHDVAVWLLFNFPCE